MSESNRRFKAYEACDLTVCPICSMLVGQVGLEPTKVKPARLQRAAIAARRLTQIDDPPHILGADPM